MTKPQIEMVNFRDITGKDHCLKKSSYKGHTVNSGRYFVLFNGSTIEICKCEVKRVFQKEKLIDNTLFTK